MNLFKTTKDRKITIDENKSGSSNLGTTPVPRLIVSLAIPAIVAQIINALYNIVDRIYIGMIPGVGDMAMTGVGVSFPIIILVSAFAQLIGSGGAPLASIELGKGNKDRAEAILGSSTASLFIISILLSIVLQTTKNPILMLFGASEITIEYADQYLFIYLLGTIFVQFSLGLNSFIASQGKIKIAMLSVLIGAILNIILDPIFIFTLNLGVKGAALATVISQAASALWIIRYLLSHKSAVRLKKKYIKFDKKVILPILALGVSPFIMQLTECLINIIFNSGLQKYGGDYYVGAMTIITSVMQLIYIFCNGITQGVQPVISYNYGAKNYIRVKTAYRLGFALHIIIGSLIVAIIMLFPTFFASLFTDNFEMINIVTYMMPIFVCGWGIFGIQSGVQCTLVGLGQAKTSLFLACLRKIILLIPLAIILPRFFGVIGIFLAEPISDIISAITAGFIFKRKIKQVLGTI